MLTCLAVVAVVVAAVGFAQVHREEGAEPAPRKTEYLASITRRPPGGDRVGVHRLRRAVKRSRPSRNP